MTSRRRRVWLGGALLAALATILALRHRTGAGVVAEGAVAAAAPSAEVPRRVPAFTPEAPAPKPLRGGRPSDADDYRPDPKLAETGPGPRFEQYGFRSGRLSPTAVPEGADRQTPVRSMKGNPTLVVWAESTRLNVGATTTVYATLAGLAGEPVAPDAITAHVTSLGGPRLATAVERRAAMKSSGQEGRYELVIDAEPRTFARVGGASPPAELNVAIEARGSYAGESFVRVAATLIFVQSPGASLRSGTAALAREGRDLVLEVEADVHRAGTYWMYAELWGGADGRVPVAFAVDRLEGVAPGLLRRAMLFGGGVIRDSGVDGPYVVRNVRLNQVDSLPPHEATPIAALPPSPPWRANEFE